jgi:hypothetical protein
VRSKTAVLVSRYLASTLLTFLATAAQAGPAPFDLAGPTLEVKIIRGAETLPIFEVPNLSVGDQIWIKADLPADQSEHYLLVIAFLSGSTNPPPKNWFYPCKTWTKECARDGLTVAVPAGAQQVLVFLAPETGGDFKTLVGAVRGRPGLFVRTSQDLNQAALDRSRLERYLSAIRNLDNEDPAKLKIGAPLLARSLAIKVDDKCLDRIPDLQAPCLMQGRESLILNDGHTTSIVEALTSGPGSDLAMEASYTPELSYGYYSPYIASVLDIARILDSFHVAQYQYIPALGTQQGDKIALTLNAAPSFQNPKSVLVAALPAVERSQLPPLHAVNPKETYCASKATLVLPVEGAPLVFATGYSHDMSLNLTASDGKVFHLPATSDALQGGYVVDTSGLRSANLGDSIHASLKGKWGFDSYEGPSFRLINTRADDWKLDTVDAATLVVGRQNTVHFHADSVTCIDGIMLKDPQGKDLLAEWKSIKPDEVEVKLPMQDALPGALTLMVSQYGTSQPQAIPLHAFSEAGRFEGFSMHAGDTQGALKGSRLDEVANLAIGKIVFLPGQLTTRTGADELLMVAQDAQAVGDLKHGRPLAAKVTLIDGRIFPLLASVDSPRPRVTLINKSVQPSASNDKSNITLVDPGELPQDATLIFSVRAVLPTAFSQDETIEVATADGSFTTTLSVGNGGMTLENPHIALIALSSTKAFGRAAFGPLQFRAISAGASGDWQPLANLVRLPALKEIDCPAAAELACKLSGSNLFLIDSLSTEPQFAHPVQVPDGFLGSALPIPHPGTGPLYVKLRDDTAVINMATLSARQLPTSSGELERSIARQPALVGDDHPVKGPPEKPPSTEVSTQSPIGVESQPAQPDKTKPQPTQSN